MTMDGGAPGREPLGRRQAQFGFRILVAIVEGVLLGALALGFMANAGSSGPGGGLAFGLAVISFTVMILLIVRAFRLARGPAGGHGVHAASRSASIRAELPRMFRPMRPVSPRQVGIGTLTGLVLLVPLAAYGNVQRSDADRSAYVQRFGVAESATVVGVWNSGYQPRAWSWNDESAMIRVELVTPVAGDIWSTAYYPATSALADGEAVRVLVDPRDPGYAELPGSPYATRAPWIFVASVVGFCLLLIVSSVAGAAVDIRRRRRDRRSSWGEAQPL
jgi:hypothetical protein